MYGVGVQYVRSGGTTSPQCMEPSVSCAIVCTVRLHYLGAIPPAADKPRRRMRAHLHQPTKHAPCIISEDSENVKQF